MNALNGPGYGLNRPLFTKRTQFLAEISDEPDRRDELCSCHLAALGTGLMRSSFSDTLLKRGALYSVAWIDCLNTGASLDRFARHGEEHAASRGPARGQTEDHPQYRCDDDCFNYLSTLQPI
jgi:hypothetical protein